MKGYWTTCNFSKRHIIKVYAKTEQWVDTFLHISVTFYFDYTFNVIYTLELASKIVMSVVMVPQSTEISSFSCQWGQTHRPMAMNTEIEDPLSLFSLEFMGLPISREPTGSQAMRILMVTLTMMTVVLLLPSPEFLDAMI